MVSKERIDELYDADKVIQENWVWERNGSSLTGEATVRCVGEGIDLTLKGWQRRNYGFCLLFKSTKVVRRWDDSIHTNPDGKVIRGSHKHFWHPEYEDNMAYPVNDVATDDVDDAFMDFLDECNIELRGKYHSQKELTEV